MLHWRDEGGYIRQGLNFYPLSNKNSAGVILRFGNRIYRVRYSKVAKKWFIGYNKVDPVAYEKWLNDGEA